MLVPGLVSVTLRNLPPEQVLDIAARAGLRAIEWGGDVHVPPGDLDRAIRVRKETQRVGLVVSSYGSYYRLGSGEPAIPCFESVIRTARALGAPLVRVWAGAKGSAATSAKERAAIVAEARELLSMCQAARTGLAFEFHENTLTDSGASARLLLDEIGCSRLRTYWQPLDTEDLAERRISLAQMTPRLWAMHVRHSSPSGERRPLVEGEEEWCGYIRMAAAAKGDVYMLLEFVRDNDSQQLALDARTLIRWIEGQ